MTYTFSRFFTLAALAFALPKTAMAQVANVDPQGSGPIVNALGWHAAWQCRNDGSRNRRCRCGPDDADGTHELALWCHRHHWLFHSLWRHSDCLRYSYRRSWRLGYDPAEPHADIPGINTAADVCWRYL